MGLSANESTMVLAVNTGSSSLRFALFEMDEHRERRLAQGAVDHIGDEQGPAWLQHGAERVERKSKCNDYDAALDYAFNLLAQQRLQRVDVIGHRVVHGGPNHVQPALVDDTLLASLERTIPFAPLHLPQCLSAIRACAARQPGTPQVACFDTAFHATLPELTRRLPLPSRYKDVRRYGFHGLSYEYVMSTLGPTPPSRIVIAHLGSGASLVAVKDGRSVDTTMGLTPTGGIFMGTRAGDLDPGVLIYLLRERGLDAGALERLLDQECGLLAIGGTRDMKALVERAGTNADAALAVDMFAYAVRKQIGAYVAALGGLDLLVFTGGIGEHSATLRHEICRGLESYCSAVVKVVKADEDVVIARHSRRVATGAL